MRAELAVLTERWQAEKARIAAIQHAKAQIEEAREEAERAERDGDLQRAAELRYGRLPELARELEDEQSALEAHGGERLLNEEVAPDDIAEVVAAWTGIPVSRLLEGEMQKLVALEGRLHERVVGQDEAVEAVSNAIRRSRSGLGDPDRPIGSFLFLGPTGVGKTELARTLAALLFDDERAVLRIDMSEYMERHSVSRLIGAPPGYVGYDEGGQLTEAVRRRPYSVVLLDEIEKAHADVFNVLLQVLDDGRLTDGQGRTVDFRNAILIMTSNVGSEVIFAESDPERMRQRVEDVLRGTFRPEFLNRIDETVIFHRLGREELAAVVDLQLERLRARLAARGLSLSVSDAARELIAEEGNDPAFGARPLKRAIQRLIENPLAKLLLEAPPAGDAAVTVDAVDGSIELRVEPRGRARPSEAFRWRGAPLITRSGDQERPDRGDETCMNRLFARLLAPTLAAAVLFVPAVAQAKPAAPKATAPKVGTTVQNMPALTWNAAKGAVQYEVQIASDSGFNPALVDVTTQNLRFVNAKMLPNGAYFWRVRSHRRGQRLVEVVRRAQVHEEVERRGGAPDPGEPEHDLLSESGDPHVGARAGRRDVSRVGRVRRGRRRRRRAGRRHLEGRARVERQQRSDHDLEHEPRRLRIAAPGHVLLAGRAGRRRGQCRRAVRDLLVRVALARHDHADGHRHGAGRRDLRPALPVARDSGRRQLRDGDQHDLGLRDGLQSATAPRRPRRRSLPARRCRTTRTTGAFAASIRRARPVPGTTARRSTRPTTRLRFPVRPNLTVRDSTLTPIALGDSTMRARRHLVDGPRRAPLRPAHGLQSERRDLEYVHGEHRLDAVRLDRQRGQAASLSARAECSGQHGERPC